MIKRPNILTISGFDPSGGSGVLADVKTFESHRCNGFAVQTVNTIQTEDEFMNVSWIESTLIQEQLSVLCKRYPLAGVKIGIIPSLNFLVEVIPIIRATSKNAIIIWDPFLAGNAGFDFQDDLSQLRSALSMVDWVTLNRNHMSELSKKDDSMLAALELSEYTKVYLRGGHNKDSSGKDYLFNKKERLSFNPKAGKYSEKHGSDCVFSSALISNLVNGYPTQKAVLRTKRYIERFLKSDTSKLGKHNT